MAAFWGEYAENPVGVPLMTINIFHANPACFGTLFSAPGYKVVSRFPVLSQGLASPYALFCL